MAMSIAGLSEKIIAEVQAQNGAADDLTKLTKMADAIAKAVYDEITINAQATGTDSMSGTVTIPPGGVS